MLLFLAGVVSTIALATAAFGVIVADDKRMARKAFVQPRPFDLS